MPYDLLFEIGCEDLPPFQVADAVQQLADAFTCRASAVRLSHGAVRRYATPRRLALYVESVAERQSDLEELVVGPPARIAYDAEGNPTQAAQGFARKLGVGLAELERVEQERKGKAAEYVAVRVFEAGQNALALLGPLLSALPGDIHWPKPMRWGQGDTAFARPIQWLTAIFGSEPVEVSYAGLQASMCTYGHRFHHPEPISLTDPSAYLDVLRSHKVLADIEERQARVLAIAHKAAAEAGGALLEDADLVDEIVQLTEWPVGVLGRFEARFLALPPRVLITSMKKHQRYFSVVDAEGAPMAAFIAVANTEVKDPEVVAQGFMRVLRARLSDAEFFIREDLKRSLDTWNAGLERVAFLQELERVFGADSGSMAARVQRVTRIACWLCEHLGRPDQQETVERAAKLCKADLTTSMVQEFPNLQGFMGSTYALAMGEPREVADAIAEHYMPRSADDEVASSFPGAVLALADGIERIIALFAVDCGSTANADPYALRRAAFAIVRTALVHNLCLDVRALSRRAVQVFPYVGRDEEDRLVDAATEFVYTRLRGVLKGEAATQVVDAVLALDPELEDIPAIAGRVRALDALRATPEFEPIATTFKRVANILAKSCAVASTHLNPESFEHSTEHALLEAVHITRDTLEGHMEARDYKRAVASLIALQSPVNALFDEVMVNAEDATVRANRHQLLREVLALFRRVADVRRL